MAAVLTTSCNLGCSYCYQKRGPQQEMALRTLRRAVEIVTTSQEDCPVLVLYGGEPLMARSVLEKALRLARKLEDPTRPLSIRLPTNGTLLDLDLIDLLDEYRVEVQLSCDGVQPSQDSRSPESFAVLERLLRLMQKHRSEFLRTRVKAAVTVSSTNVSHLANSFLYLSDFGFKAITITPLFTHDQGWTQESTAILDGELDRIRRLCAWRLEETGRDSFSPLRRFRNRPGPQGQQSEAICTAADGTCLMVDVDGRLAPCLLVAPSIAPSPPGPLAEKLAALDRGHIDEPWDKGAISRFVSLCKSTGLFHGRERKYSSWGRCCDCEFQDECDPCPVATAWIPGNGDPDRIPDHVCAFNRVLASHRRLMPASASNVDRLLGEVPLPGALKRLLDRTSRIEAAEPVAGASDIHTR